MTDKHWEALRSYLEALPVLAERRISASDGMGYALLLRSAAKHLESHAMLCEALSASEGLPNPQRWARG